MSQLKEFIGQYRNDREHNERYYTQFTELTGTLPFLKAHRDHIEAHQLGFGDRAFHYMWYLLLQDVTASGGTPDLLEIGVYKGQVISLWSVIARQLQHPVRITAVSPLEGNFSNSKLINNRYVRRLLWLFSRKHREQFSVGNHYLKVDYRKIISDLFRHFGEDLDTVKLHKGFSNDPAIFAELSKQRYHLIYIDGDHSYEGACSDIKHYGPLVVPGGYMVMDDASWYLEGDNFWKGHEPVSRACDHIEALGFTNVLNIGHNRVYRKNS